MSITPDTYLDAAVDRLVAGWKEVLAALTPPITQVVKYLDQGLTPPFAWLYPGSDTPQAISQHRDSQLYVVTARVVIGYTTEKYDGELAQALWVYLPTIHNYFMSHKALVLDEDDDEPPYLDSSKTGFRQTTPFGEFSSLNHVGLELSHVLVFIKPNEQFF